MQGYSNFSICAPLSQLGGSMIGAECSATAVRVMSGYGTLKCIVAPRRTGRCLDRTILRKHRLAFLYMRREALASLCTSEAENL
jgi:hypothetical protein